jgi:hypothetical protein
MMHQLRLAPWDGLGGEFNILYDAVTTLAREG